MDLAEELERKGLGVTIKGHWLGACFFADDIVLPARSGKELQTMLDVVGEVEDKVQSGKVWGTSSRTEETEEIMESRERNYRGSGRV